MQTILPAALRATPEGQEAETILRKCVHCGFCTATCPTYQLLGDELDGPRGRIYLIKQMLERGEASAATRSHLDRCLTCRACETTCPSGVEYAKLVDIGRAEAERLAPRPAGERLQRWVLARALRSPLFGAALRLGRRVRPLLPAALAAKVVDAAPQGVWPAPRHARRMLVLDGCVQPAMLPDVNAAAARVLDRLGISLLRPDARGCCGALRFHLNEQEGGRADARALLEQWWPLIERGEVEALVITASGCGSFVKEYEHLFAHDPLWRERAARVAALTRDLGEVLAAEHAALAQCLQGARGPAPRLAFHAPCSLQHGQKLPGLVEGVLRQAGFELAPVRDAHLCCGSAGAYSLLQPELSSRLRAHKLAALSEGEPVGVASANVGCIAHLQGGSGLPVRHWAEWLDARLIP